MIKFGFSWEKNEHRRTGIFKIVCSNHEKWCVLTPRSWFCARLSEEENNNKEVDKINFFLKFSHYIFIDIVTVIQTLISTVKKQDSKSVSFQVLHDNSSSIRCFMGKDVSPLSPRNRKYIMYLQYKFMIFVLKTYFWYTMIYVLVPIFDFVLENGRQDVSTWQLNIRYCNDKGQ